MEKLVQILDSHETGKSRTAKEHAMIGILLGYSKEDIRKFIHDKN